MDDRSNANILNNSFSSVFTKENIESMSKPRNQFNERKGSKLTDTEIEPPIVEKKLRNLKLNKAAGMDGIHTNILKALSEEISLPLCMIFRKSLNEGVVPLDWRAADVVPLYKKGAKNNPSNYRPVSLTSVVCKILESIIKDAISIHLESNTLIKGSQHGFSSGRSCLTNLLIYLEQVTSEIDKGVPVDTLYLDFAKAFDKVPHLRLIEKIAANGIGGKISRWIKCWLTDRKQRVIVNNATSDWLPVLSGVPQGSVLGPCLFVIYINDIDDTVSSKILKFADDTKITASISSVEEQHILQTDLTRLMEWSEEWQMKFNVNKCKVMHLGYNNPSYEYSMNDEVLIDTEEERDLGVTIHKSLKPSCHIAHCVKKANQMLGMIRRSFHYKDRKTMLLLYKSMVRPHLEYAVQAWCPNKISDIKLLEGVQRRFTKCIPELSKLPYEMRLKNLNLTTLETRRIRGDLIEVYRIMNGIEAIDWKLLFSKAPYDGTRGHTMKLEKKVIRLDIRKYFFSQRVIDYWNALPQIAIDAKSINQFKSQLKIHLNNIIRGLHKPLAFSLFPTPLLN